MKHILIIICSVLFTFSSFSQNLNLKFCCSLFGPSYQSTGCSDPNSHCFAGPNWAVWYKNGYTSADISVKATNGCVQDPWASGSGLYFPAVHRTGSQARTVGAGMLLAYNFKKGYTYNIFISAKFSDALLAPGRSYENDPSLQLQVTNTYTTDVTCQTEAPPIDISSTTNPYYEMQDNAAVAQWAAANFTFTAQNCYSYLWLSSKPSTLESQGGVTLSELDITETPPNYSVSGSATICSGAQSYSLSVNGSPYTGAVTWAMTPTTGVATLSCTNCSQPFITKNGTGYVNLTATFANPCNSTNSTVSKRIAVGTPTVGDFSFAKSGSTCISHNGSPLSFGVTYGGSSGCNLNTQALVTSVDWQISPPSGSNGSYTETDNAGIYACSTPSQVNKAGISIGFSPPVQSYVMTLRYRVNNACGSSLYSPGNSVPIQTCVGSKFTVSPNPSVGTLKIALDENTNLSNDKNSDIREIDINDKFGNVIKRFNYNAGTKYVTLNISDLKTNVYFIKIFDGKEWTSQEIIKK